MIYDYEIFPVQFEFNIPVLGVLMDVWDWDVFRATLASYWNEFRALNQPPTMISVFSF